MAFQMTVLASGSAGNATLLQVGGFGLLIDAGLGPRQLAERFQAAGLSWAQVDALALTHTHSDHWNDRTLAHLLRRRAPLYCHAGHEEHLRAWSPSFGLLVASDLVRTFEPHEPFSLAPGLTCRPLPVRHDGGPTFGFRFEAAPDLFGGTCQLAYLADLGCWDEELADHLADVDLLALEFNHDVAMEYASGRSMRLIRRVLGDDGHLSNEQAADLLRAVLQRSTPGRLRHVVQLHLSADCNRPLLAAQAAQAALTAHQHDAEIHTARQDEPLPTLSVAPTAAPRARRPARGRRGRRVAPVPQPWLPGLEAG